VSPETRKTVLVAAGAAAVPSLLAVVLVLRSESRIHELETALASPAGEPHASAGAPSLPSPPKASVPSVQPSAPPADVPGSDPGGARLDARGIPVDRIVTYDSFERLWRGDLAREANNTCWRPLEAAGNRLQPTTHFVVTVSAKGDVTDVAPDSVDTDEASQKLHACVAKIVRKVRFPEPGKAHNGRVQADRQKS
jgi:hypothetical protein